MSIFVLEVLDNDHTQKVFLGTNIVKQIAAYFITLFVQLRHIPMQKDPTYLKKKKKKKKKKKTTSEIHKIKIN